jgi:23S rRNA (uracil1939-C5)-methyltransferase
MDHDILSEFQAWSPRHCPHAAACPGCPLLGLPYAEQLAHKTELVRSALRPYAELDAVGVSSCAAAPETYGYRTRAKWVSAQNSLGLYARGTHRVLDLPGCLVVHPDIARAGAALRALLPAHALLEGVDLARLEGRLLVTLIGTDAAPEPELRALGQRLAEALPEVAGIALTRRAADAVQLLSAGHVCVHGQAELRVRASSDGPYHYLAFGAFVQAHALTAGAIYAELARGCLEAGAASAPSRAEPSPRRLLELYAGSGALALSLAARGLAVTAVESYAPACERIARAAREQGLDVRVEQGDAEASLLAHVARGARFDLVLLNPPRRGLTPGLRAALAALSPARVGYVSCRPATLARDLAHLARLGLRATQVQPFDMMPQTDQVESLVWLTPSRAAPARLLGSGAAWVALDKSAHEPIEAEAAAATSLLARVAPEYANHRACYQLGLGSSGVVLLAAPGASGPVPTRRVFTALVRGITHKRGRAQGLVYQRERVLGGHSLLRVEADSDARIARVFRGLGHPVLGDARSDRASAKHFWLRHGLDRPFLHLGELALAEESTLLAPLPADLGAVLSSLEAGEARAGAEEPAP